MLAVTPPSYAQLSEADLALLRAAVTRHGSIAAVAAALGYSRPSISMALSGQYKGNTGRLAARIRDVLRAAVECPHLGQTIAASRCAELRALPLSTSNRAALKQWQACRVCPHGATRETEEN